MKMVSLWLETGKETQEQQIDINNPILISSNQINNEIKQKILSLTFILYNYQSIRETE